MKFIIYPAGAYGTNCYIVYDESSNYGFVIDPGEDGDEIINIINKKCIKIKFIILTHGHFDHTGAVNMIKNEFKIPVFINEKDNALVSGDGKNNGNLLQSSDTIIIDRFINDGEIINYGNESLKIIYTPGHTEGGISVQIGNVLFSGDTLFRSSIGRTDFKGGSYEQLIDSIKKKLLVMPDETEVYPGHGTSTTIGFERKNNPFL